MSQLSDAEVPSLELRAVHKALSSHASDVHAAVRSTTATLDQITVAQQDSVYAFLLENGRVLAAGGAAQSVTTDTIAYYEAALRCAAVCQAAIDQVRAAGEEFAASAGRFEEIIRGHSVGMLQKNLGTVLRENTARSLARDPAYATDPRLVGAYQCSVCLGEFDQGERCLLRRLCANASCEQCTCRVATRCVECVAATIYHHDRGVALQERCPTCTHRYCVQDICLVSAPSSA